jgi:hypothetical protein
MERDPLRAPPHRGWRIKRESSSHKTLSRPGWPDLVFVFPGRDETGPMMR